MEAKVQAEALGERLGLSEGEPLMAPTARALGGCGPAGEAPRAQGLPGRARSIGEGAGVRPPLVPCAEGDLRSPRKLDMASVLRTEMQQLEQKFARQMARLCAEAQALAGQLRREGDERRADVQQLREELASRGAAESNEVRDICASVREAIADQRLHGQRHEQHRQTALAMLGRQHERLQAQADLLEQHDASIAELCRVDAEALVSIQKLEESCARLGASVAEQFQGPPGSRPALLADQAAGGEPPGQRPRPPPELAAQLEGERCARQAAEAGLHSRLRLLEQRVACLTDPGHCQRFYIGSPDLREGPASDRGTGAAKGSRGSSTAEDLVAALATAAADAAAGAQGGAPPAAAAAAWVRVSGSGGGTRGASHDELLPVHSQSGDSLAAERLLSQRVLGSEELEDKFVSMHDAVDQLWRKAGETCILPGDSAVAGRGGPHSATSPCLSVTDMYSTRAESAVGIDPATPTTTTTASSSWAEGLAKLAPHLELASPAGLAAAARDLREENAALRGALLRLAEDPRFRFTFEHLGGSNSMPTRPGKAWE